MIDFMIISSARSGSTWAANYLTTDKSLCLHDPLFRYHYTELDGITSKRDMIGVACTGLYHFPEWVNAHSARKVILHRDVKEINHSLMMLGLPGVGEDTEDKLNAIEGIHKHWTSLFDEPEMIYSYLLQTEFDAERHKMLKEMAIQPAFSRLQVDWQVTSRLVSELAEV